MVCWGHRRREPGQRGAVLVEAVIVLPLVLLLTFGIIEFGLAFRESAQLHSAARSGARIFSALPRNPNQAQRTIEAVASQVQGLGDLPDEMWIYKATGGDNPPGVCAEGSCISYTWDDTDNEFVYAGGSWPESSQNACADESADRVGVYLQGTHDTLTPAYFGADKVLTANAIMRLEPFVGEGACSP